MIIISRTTQFLIDPFKRSFEHLSLTFTELNLSLAERVSRFFVAFIELCPGLGHLIVIVDRKYFFKDRNVVVLTAVVKPEEDLSKKVETPTAIVTKPKKPEIRGCNRKLILGAVLIATLGLPLILRGILSLSQTGSSAGVGPFVNNSRSLVVPNFCVDADKPFEPALLSATFNPNMVHSRAESNVEPSSYQVPKEFVQSEPIHSKSILSKLTKRFARPTIPQQSDLNSAVVPYRYSQCPGNALKVSTQPLSQRTTVIPQVVTEQSIGILSTISKIVTFIPVVISGVLIRAITIKNRQISKLNEENRALNSVKTVATEKPVLQAARIPDSVESNLKQELEKARKQVESLNQRIRDLTSQERTLKLAAGKNTEIFQELDELWGIDKNHSESEIQGYKSEITKLKQEVARLKIDKARTLKIFGTIKQLRQSKQSVVTSSSSSESLSVKLATNSENDTVMGTLLKQIDELTMENAALEERVTGINISQKILELALSDQKQTNALKLIKLAADEGNSEAQYFYGCISYLADMKDLSVEYLAKVSDENKDCSEILSKIRAIDKMNLKNNKQKGKLSLKTKIRKLLIKITELEAFVKQLSALENSSPKTTSTSKSTTSTESKEQT